MLDLIQELEIGAEFPEAIHTKALELVREYMSIGGMPMVVSSYLNNQSLKQTQEYQTLLLNTYGDDFAKYAAISQHKYLQKVYERTPGLVGQQIKYVNISSDLDSRYLKKAIHDLSSAGIIFPVYSTSAAGLPLLTHVQEKKFKLIFLDVGLLKRASKLDLDVLLSEDLILINRGTIAEQYVGQELLAYHNPYEEPQIYYWARDQKNSNAEVDYLINIGSKIIPIEVKSGKTGRLKSLHLLMQERNLPLGIRISEKSL